MFERFQHDARAAVAEAEDEAARAGEPEVGTAHLLLGLLSRPGQAADALRAAGADVTELRDRIVRGMTGAQSSMQPGGKPPVRSRWVSAGEDPWGRDDARQIVAGKVAVGKPASERAASGQDAAPVLRDDVRLTREARRALDAAQRTAHRLKDQRVSTGHVLLGLIDQPDDPTVGALSVAGIKVGTLRADVLKRMSAAPDPGDD